MKTFTLILMGVLLMAFSCEDQKKVETLESCDVKDPLTELEWLREEIEYRNNNPSDISKYFYIEQGEIDGETVFLYNDCCPMCMTLLIVRNCEGEELYPLHESPSPIKNLKVIWRPVDCPCTFD